MKNFSLTHIMTFMGAYQAIKACTKDDNEIDFGRMFLEHPRQISDFMDLVGGEGAKDKPLHEAIREMTESLPAEMLAMSEYFNNSLTPALQEFTALLNPKG